MPQDTKLGIKDVAISRFFISSNKELLKRLKDNDIKVFVYYINQDGGVTDSGMDEDYVTNMNLIMYADKWDCK